MEMETDVCLQVSNMCIGALNFLYSGFRPALSGGAMNKFPSTAQQTSQRHICSKVVRFLGRLVQELGNALPWQRSFQQCEVSATPSYEDICSDRVDLPAQAASCDPSGIISKCLSSQIADASCIFPAGVVSAHLAVPQNKRSEYLKLTCRELECGKLRLRRQVCGMGGVFAVGKRGGRQRKIWDGAGLSQMAAAPPKPRRLANPSSFLDVQFDVGQQVFFSKRDASTFFDALQAPEVLQPFFGQPAVTAQELLDHGMTRDAIAKACDDSVSADVSGHLYPVHAVWPMGFAWSSAVAQDTTLAVCASAGIAEESILSLDHDVPVKQDELCFVATDDTVLLHTSKTRGQRTLANLDAAFAEHGVPRNVAKDVSLANEITALGCDLSSTPAAKPVEGCAAASTPASVSPLLPLPSSSTSARQPRLTADLGRGSKVDGSLGERTPRIPPSCPGTVRAEPGAAKIAQAVCRTLGLLRANFASPKAFHSLLGVWEWFALLQRGFFSIYDGVYSFARKEPATELTRVPEAALNEMLVTLLLAPLLSVDLDRQPLQQLVATDAAPQFGFGVSVASCSRQEAVEICGFAERRGDYVRLTTSPDDPVEVPRLGVPSRLSATEKDFKTVISSKAKWPAHSGVLEAHAYLLALRWVARHAAKHGSKVPLLVDAKVVVGAVTKGRSSAKALRHALRSVAAVSMAANLLPRAVYIPSESNPADAPSRGKRNKPRSDRFCKRTSVKRRLLSNLQQLV
ncbi:unnamed protein product [Symbiodinium natans]|uniref:Uncharacterized protein n=1 Tax=Symbiodinium natans TaxID=878477 RepID=A0A812TVB3_9DINO|nr:unnamed protein product [Symbiodinium natans]